MRSLSLEAGGAVRFDVSHTSGGNVLVKNPTAANITFETTTNSDQLQLHNGGNVGMGIGSPSFSSVNDVAAANVKGLEIFKNGTDTATALKLGGDNGAGTKAWSQLGYSGANGTAHWANYNTAGVLQ